MNEEFEKINRRIKSLSTAVLAEAFLNLMGDLHGERLAARALLEAHADWSSKRVEFRRAMRQRIAKTLMLRSPKLNPSIAGDVAIVILQNMKTVGVLNAELRGKTLSGALKELREMTRLYLSSKVGD